MSTKREELAERVEYRVVEREEDFFYIQVRNRHPDNQDPQWIDLSPFAFPMGNVISLRETLIKWLHELIREGR